MTPLEIMFYIYILQSIKDKNWYTGYTDNLKRRITEHNQGKNFSTRHRKPFKLIYYEACLNLQDAKSREKFLKTGMGKRYIKNRLKNYLKISNGV